MKSESTLTWLLTRLSWPSTMIRERACVQLGALLLHPQFGMDTKKALLGWIAVQPLESLAALGILPFLRARMQEVQYSIVCDEIVAAFKKPSLLAWLLLNELDPTHGLSFEKAAQHRETAPRDFSPGAFFDDFVQYFLPPSYERHAQFVEQGRGIPLYHQWAFEWKQLLDELSLTPSRAELDDWHRRLPGKEHYAAIDTQLSEVYRSAFLRAIAWGADNGLSLNEVQLLAAHTCPVDLDLWCIMPQPRPSWWPQIQTPIGKVDISASDIWQQIESLWQRYQQNFDEEPVLVAANGIIAHQQTIYNLEIYGLYQRCIGPEQPAVTEITEWIEDTLNTGHSEIRMQRPSLLRFNGKVKQRPPGTWLRRFADWEVLPTAGPISHFGAVPRWQWWRVHRGIWLPAPYLTQAALSITCTASGILIGDGKREIGKWTDWPDDIGETIAAGVPPKSGFVLQVSRSTIEEFAQQTGMVFCWLCRLTGYQDELSSQEYRSFSTEQVYGASHIILP